MTCIVIFGEAETSEKLLRASLNDTLDTQQQFKPDDPITLAIAGSTPTIEAVRQWADDNEVPHKDSRFPTIAVSEAFTRYKSNTRVLALIGDAEPTGEVAKALAMASKHSLEIRDLAEAGLTWVYQEGTPHQDTLKENSMPRAATAEPDPVEEDEVEYTWEQIGAMADEGDEDAQGLIATALAEAGIEDEHEDSTYSEAAAALAALEDEVAREAAGDPPVDEDEPETETEEDAAVGFSPEDFKGKNLKAVREIAKASNIENAGRLGREELIDALCGINRPEPTDEAEDADLPQPPPPYDIPTSDPTEFPPAVIDAIANAVIAKLAARLSA